MSTKNCGQPWLLRKSNWHRTTESLRRLSCGWIVVGALLSQGCQGLGLRSQDDVAFLNEEEDDWYYPNQSSSKIPRPSLADLGSKAGKEGRSRYLQKSAPIKSRYAQQESDPSALAANSSASDREPSLVAYGPSSDNSSEGKLTASPTLLDTHQSEVDVEGALESLPPAYRDILRKQLAVVQSGSMKNRPEEAIAKATSTEKPALEQETSSPIELLPKTELASSPETAMRGNTAPIVGSKTGIAATDSSPKKGVSIRMNDAEPVSSKLETQLAEAAKAEGNVVQASTASADASSATVALASVAIPSVPPPAATTWKQGVGQAIELLEKQIKETPSNDESLLLSQEMTLRMLYVSQRRLDDALRPIPLLNGNESEQQFVHHQMLALYEASNPDAMPVRSRHWSIVMNSQREATNHLAAASNLEVKSLAFCTEVERYGVVTKFPKTQFQADQEVLLYCEIENVAAEKVRNGFETQLQGSYEIMDSQGRKIADQLLPMEPELCQNHRRDYFIVYKIYMPPQIAIGNYQMRLTIEDMKARKFGQSQLEFSIKK
jgi:hypothetical protein